MLILNLESAHKRQETETKEGHAEQAHGCKRQKLERINEGWY